MWITFPPSLYFSSVEASVEMPFLTTLSGLATTLTLFLTPYFHCSFLNNKQLPDLSHDFHFYSLTKHCFLSFRSDLPLNKKIKSKTCAVAFTEMTSYPGIRRFLRDVFSKTTIPDAGVHRYQVALSHISQFLFYYSSNPNSNI